MGIYHSRPSPFNFLNGMGMKIILNKWDKVRMEVTIPNSSRCHPC